MNRRRNASDDPAKLVNRTRRAHCAAAVLWLAAARAVRADAVARRAKPIEGDYVIPTSTSPPAKRCRSCALHYTTLGKPRRDAHGRVNNAVLILHGTGGSGHSFLVERFAGVLFGKGQLLDANRYYIILPDGIGHGASSKPSDGLHAHFPQYDYEDMVAAQYALLTQGLQVDHLRLVMGTSMGCMHTWMWGERYPDFMDALMPLACLPVQIAGRNRVWRDLLMDAIRTDPQWMQGEYRSEPMDALRTAAGLLLIAGSAPIQMQIALPTRDAADEFVQKYMERRTGRPGCERPSVPGRRLARLRPVRRPREDQGAAHVDQLGRRFRQPAGTRHRGARDQAGEERPLRAAARLGSDARTRHAHLGGGVAAVPRANCWPPPNRRPAAVAKSS